MQNEFLDAILSLIFGSLYKSSLFDTLPILVFNLTCLWLAVDGLKRHRVRGFLLLLVASILGLTSCLMLIVINVNSSEFSPENARLVSIAGDLVVIEFIFFTAGIWHFVYRARFAPPEPTPQ